MLLGKQLLLHNIYYESDYAQPASLSVFSLENIIYIELSEVAVNVMKIFDGLTSYGALVPPKILELLQGLRRITIEVN